MIVVIVVIVSIVVQTMVGRAEYEIRRGEE